MYQLPVNNLTRIRRARKQVKVALGDIGLEFCKEAAEEFKDFCPNEQFVKGSLCLDICGWDPSYSKTQEYRSKPFCCTECSFSSKYYSGYKTHFRNVHRKIFDSKILLNCPYCTFTASKRTLETHVKIFHIPSSARQNYGNAQGNALGKKDKTYLDRVRQGDGVEKAMYFCKKCSFRDTLYNVVRRHIYREHFQHVVSPYLGMVSESSVKNGANSVNGNNILCKRCQFSTRSYEALVQHVVEYHERIGAQVTTMIGHANIIVSRTQSLPAASQKAPPIMSRGHTLRTDPIAQPVIGYLKPMAPAVKNQSAIAASKIRVAVPGNSTVAENNAAGVNTAQTQKWKICTVCNELFPENLYNAHFENAHKAKKVWALAKYIMKIHNFTSKCLLCNRYLPSDTLLNHMLIHGLTCPQCHSAFHNVEKIIEHVAQSHPDDFVGPPGASPLTFDLTIKQDKSINVQLVVLTFNMKESINGQNQSSPAQNSVPPLVKLTAPKSIEKKGEPLARSFASPPYKSEVGKTLCPLCFTILKGPISDALAMHLRERHQVLQTMHPVEKKMTYKCIHCLGVYTSNMVASTITLHLVQCRAVGRNQASQGFKSALTLNSSGAGFLKRQPPTQAMSNPKRMKLSKESKISSTTVGNRSESDSLALDPRSYEHKTYEARKNFLTAYFNRRPYLSPQEEEKLSASLWLWKSDISSHFATKRRMCERQCQTKKLSVLLGFDMHALKKVKHNLVFEETKFGGTSAGRAGGLKSGTPSTDQNKQCETLNCTLQLSTCTETISIDSDSEPETEERPTEERPREERPREERLTEERLTEERLTEERPREERPREERPTEERPREERPREERPREERPTEERPTEERPTEERLTEERLTEERPREERPREERPREERPREERPREERPTEERPTEERPREERPREERPTEERPREERPTEERPREERPTEERPTEERLTEERPTEERPTEERPTEERPTEERPTEERPTEERPTEERPTEERPTEERPTEERPTEERPTENGNVDTNQDNDVKSEEPANLTEEMEPLKADDPSIEKESSLQDGQTNAWMTFC